VRPSVPTGSRDLVSVPPGIIADCGAPAASMRAQQLLPIHSSERGKEPHATVLTETPHAPDAPAARWLSRELADLTGEWSPDELVATARAASAWLANLRGSDPGGSHNRRPVASEELRLALRVLRSLFNWHTHPELTLSGAVLWSGLLLDLEAAARARGERSPVPLPHLWLSPGKLESDQRWGASELTDEPMNGSRDADDGEVAAGSAALWPHAELMPLPALLTLATRSFKV
jgi:hypothetical protein